jgi:hypothetical protein
MMITGNEVAVDNQMRRAEKQSRPPVDRLLQGASSTAEALSIATGSVAIGGIAKAFSIAKRFTSGLGVATLSENLDHLGDATEAALSRVEKNLEAQGFRIEEIERRLNSNEFLEGIKAATLQAQRTKDKKRLERMALILANGVAENDLEPESLDDMMRAAVELSEKDILELGVFISRQSTILAQAEKLPMQWYDNIRRHWQSWAIEDGAMFRDGKLSYFELNSSRSKLAAVGFIIAISPVGTTNSPDAFPYALLPEGKRFYERLQEIGAMK